VTGDEEIPNFVGLLAVKDMFSLIPANNGSYDVTINKASLTLYRYLGPKDTPFSIARVTSDWLPQDAGVNQIHVSGLWSTYDDGEGLYMSWVNWYDGFSDEDYDTSTMLDVAIQDGTGAAMQQYDITGLVEDMYAEGTNYGLAFIPEPGFVSPDYGTPADYYGIYFNSSDNTNEARRPVLQIDYQYGPDYVLTVNGGTGSGDYAEGVVVSIAADPEAGTFEAWTGDVAYVTDVNAADTTVTMPAGDVTVTATFAVTEYTLTVNSGTGGGTYDADEVVAIVAGAAPSGQQFDAWVGDVAGVDDVNAASTTITMPASDVEITATYENIPCTLAADRNGDDFVGQADLDIILGAWGQHVAVGSAADPSGDGFVGQADLDIILGQWGQSCPQ
jgi:hypothetical protein